MLPICLFKIKKREKNTESSEHLDLLLCRFVVDGTGNRIGESIAIDTDLLIVKSQTGFLGIPLKHVEYSDASVVVKGLVDKQKAYMLGENWQKRSTQKNTSPSS